MNYNDNGMKWYIYGLSANPPTNAHHEIIKQISLMNVPLTVVPSYNHPLKTNLIDFKHRVNMLNLLCEAFSNVCVSEIEKETQPTTTYDLIVSLRSRIGLFERTIFVIVCDFFIMMDILNMKRKHSSLLIESDDVAFCVVLNNSNDIDNDRRTVLEHDNSIDKDISFVILDTIYNDTRSTVFRNNPDLSEELLPECVYRYIRSNAITFT